MKLTKETLNIRNYDSPQETTQLVKSSYQVIRETKCFYFCVPEWCVTEKDIEDYLFVSGGYKKISKKDTSYTIG